MTIPGPGGHMSERGLVRLAESFAGQEDVGLWGSILIRLARYLGGDPSAQISVSAAVTQTQGLPDNTPAHSAVVVVTGAPIFYRMDGGNVGPSDAPLPVGAVITLTGQPTIKGFRFTTQTAVTATLTGAFYT